MSVLKISKEQFEIVAYNAKGYQYRKVVDSNYCHALSLNDKEIELWVLELQNLNEKSYINRYRLDNNSIKEVLDFNKKHKSITPFQMLKFLESIRYNIEVCFDNMAYKKLNEAINEIRSHIIYDIEEYKESKWIM